ncbi:facilitated trehalose transporter Tret1-like isoform X2 [Photinus pyralis]|uniref:facilitated trehalose transporter Tret1-like isoform X2 n=1 Tax=Photinus pyralis TaxID=7054 RepID=UPI001266FAB5|nr:facilitated trehalose transporter Tret1-like isoform X2 [Photinus pyralis]
MFLQALFRNSRTKGILAGFAPFTFAACTAWPSPSLPLLTSSNSPIGITLSHEEASWVAASLFLGIIPGSIIQGLLLDKLGPKGLLQLSSAVLFVPWIMIGFADSVPLLIAGRFISGLGCGITLSTTPIYICEIASNDIRGKLGVIAALITTCGGVLVFSVGPFVGYTALTMICGIFPIILGVSMTFAPESPYYLLKKGRQTDARTNLVRLCASSSNSDRILGEMNETLRRDKADRSLIELLLTPNFRRSLLVVLGAKSISEFSGGYAITAYMQTIMEVSQSNLSPQLSSVIYSLVQIPAMILSSILIDRLGRKPVFSISAFGACVSLLGEGTYFYLQGKVNLEAVAFIPITCLTLYRVLVSFGLSHLPYFLTGELFNTETKKVGGFIFGFYSGLVGFLNSKLFSTITSAWGIYTSCWIFAGVCAVGVLFGLFFIPETKGKTLGDIQNSLSSTKE